MPDEIGTLKLRVARRWCALMKIEAAAALAFWLVCLASDHAHVAYWGALTVVTGVSLLGWTVAAWAVKAALEARQHPWVRYWRPAHPESPLAESVFRNPN